MKKFVVSWLPYENVFGCGMAAPCLCVKTFRLLEFPVLGLSISDIRFQIFTLGVLGALAV